MLKNKSNSLIKKPDIYSFVKEKHKELQRMLEMENIEEDLTYLLESHNLSGFYEDKFYNNRILVYQLFEVLFALYIQHKAIIANLKLENRKISQELKRIEKELKKSEKERLGT